MEIKLKKNGDIKKLEKLAKEILVLKEITRPRRPLIIEFCGSPKSGKTACVNSLNIFLKRNGFKTKVLTERASICPVPTKTDPLFNIWTACSSIAEIIKFFTLGEGIDVIIADRGIFDSLCWMNWHLQKSRIEEKEKSIIKSFFTIKEWWGKIDIVYVFTVKPELSLEREFANLLTPKAGSIMNTNTLKEFNISINETLDEFKSAKSFKEIKTIDTGTSDQNGVSKEVTNESLKALKTLLMEKIGYFDFNVTDDLKNGFNDFSCLANNANLEFGGRESVEKGKYLQPIPIAVLVNKSRDKILAVKKHSKSVDKNSPEKGKLLLYAGGHIRKEDKETKNEDFISIIKSTLIRELKEELRINLIPSGTPFLIYTPDNEKSKKHLAICFVIEIDEDMKVDPNPIELVQKRGKSKSGHFMSIDDILKDDEKLESWSKEILKKVFNLNIIQKKQLSLEL